MSNKKESFDWPSVKRDFRSYRPTYEPKRSTYWASVAWVLVGFASLVLIGVVVFLTFSQLLGEKAEAAEITTEAEWEKEICGNLEEYSNQADFRAYCDYRLTH